MHFHFPLASQVVTHIMIGSEMLHDQTPSMYCNETAYLNAHIKKKTEHALGAVKEIHRNVRRETNTPPFHFETQVE